MGWAEDLTNWASDKLKGKDNKFGGDDALKIAGGLAGLYGLSRVDNSETLSNFFGTSSPPALGYQGKIPELSAVRSRVPLTYDPSRRPGSGGQRYFSDTRYVGKDDAAAAQATADEEAIELAAENILNPARQNRAAARKLPAGGEEGLLELFQNIRNSPYTSEAQKIAQTSGLMDLYNISPMGYSQLTGAPLYNVQAGMHPHYQAQTTPTVIPPLAGEVAPTLSDTTETVVDDTVVDDTVVDDTVVDDTVVEDTIETATSGMADRIPATIEDKQEARLSDGEFVIPADVVSHLGNGNSQAGASHLYEMMGKVRQARTGNSQQGKEINPNKYMPV